MMIITVEPGDTLYQLARRYNIPMQSIIDANRLTNPDRLIVGQDLVLPMENRQYTVRQGDSLYSIARANNLPLSALITANPSIEAPYVLSPGQSIILPTGPAAKPTIEVNGYAYPGITDAVLRDTLPYLTYLSIFGYRANSSGGFDSIADERLIRAARAANVAPIMVMTNIRATGGFDSELAGTILNSPEIRGRLIQNIIANLEAKEYAGINIDFEYIPPRDREAYNTFMRELAAALDASRFTLLVALAPKNRADQPGTLYEAHDYAAQGAINDRVILMTYEWGYTYGPPMAISPVPEIVKVLNYATSVIPPQKILMGMSNYAYDWTLPFQRGTAAQGLTVNGALRRAGDVGARIQYNQTMQAPYYTYYDSSGKQHEVWFENARSIEARLKLVTEYGLAGVSYWTINNFFPQNWLVLQNMFTVKKVL